jgi:predicted DCC family thiol-disulfide oxidoreductase YuxK
MADPKSGGADTSTETDDTVDPVALTREHPVLLFDGVCNLCNGSIQFVIEHDPEATFRFAPLQSAVAQELLRECGYEGATLDSVVLVDDGECYDKSDAVIRAARHLGFPYSLLGPFGVVPSRLRNVFYDFVAERRYRWFGKRDQCMMPTPDIEQRFLAGGPGPDGD